MDSSSSSSTPAAAADAPSRPSTVRPPRPVVPPPPAVASRRRMSSMSDRQESVDGRSIGSGRSTSADRCVGVAAGNNSSSPARSVDQSDTGDGRSPQHRKGRGGRPPNEVDVLERRTRWKSGVSNLSFEDDAGCLTKLFEEDSAAVDKVELQFDAAAVTLNIPPEAVGDDGEAPANGDCCPGAAADDKPPEITVDRVVGGPPSDKDRSWLIRRAFAIAAAIGGSYGRVPSAGNGNGSSMLQLVDFSPGVPADTQPLLLDDGSGESSLRIIGETLMPFLLAGFGCVFAGLVLDVVQHWRVFVEVSEIFILVPALLGLKGNLEMTLASRLSTQANLGHMDSPGEQWKMIAGNLALTQAQAIVVGQLAAIFAILLSWIPQGKFNVMQGFLLCASSVLTAALASLILGSIMVGVVLLSRRFHINPDNVATPIAASLGDLTTISLLAAISMALFNTLETHVWITPLLLFTIIALIPLWWYISHYNDYTHNVLYTGWTPVIGAMVISSLGGLVLDHTVVNFDGIAVFQPVINGVGGNLVAVQASRLSTALHRVANLGHLPEDASHACSNPITTFFGKSSSARTARVLLLMVIPGQLIFMFAIKYLQSTQSVAITVPFAAIYLAASFLQVLLLLYLANWLVNFLWWRGSDPDNASIPYLTAVGDLLGTVLLAGAFYILYVSGNL